MLLDVMLVKGMADEYAALPEGSNVLVPTTLEHDGTSHQQRSWYVTNLRIGAGEEERAYPLGVFQVSGTTVEEIGSAVTKRMNEVQDVATTIAAFFPHVAQFISYVSYATITATMSDHCNAAQAFNKYVECQKKKELPTVISNWDSLSPAQQHHLTKLFSLLCGMHKGLNLGDAV